MKNVVVNELGRENDVKPSAIFEKYLKLTAKDVRQLFKGAPKAKSCPACGSKCGKYVFNKFGQPYAECRSCSSVYAIFRPSDERIREHYLRSTSACFWAENLSKSTTAKRKVKIYSPRLQWIKDMSEEYLIDAESIGDLRSKNPGFIDELLSDDFFRHKEIINPYFNTAEAPTSQMNLDMITLFEVIDYTSELSELFKQVRARLRKGGLVFLTTISISGFDLQVLWENSKSIFPPDRLNSFSRRGLEIILKKHGFEILEHSTPGVRDVDMVRNAIRQEPGLALPRFVRTMLDSKGDQLDRDFQNFLQVNRLSSFVRFVIRKK
ncbi:MAG: methyltransferase domain-containing protein [Candidatus Margulisiibacteriota bacterium]